MCITLGVKGKVGKGGKGATRWATRPTRCPIATDFGFMKIELQMKPK